MDAPITLQQLTDRYADILTQYLNGAGETALQQAYELGRSAIAGGLGVLDISRMYQHALAAIPFPALPAEENISFAARAASFLGESLSPFEMTHRGFQEIIKELRDRTTDLSRANEELERSLALLRATLDATADGILVVSRDGTVDHYNKRFQEMWGLDHPLHTAQEVNEALGDILRQLQNPEMFLRELRQSGLPKDDQGLMMLYTKDGKIFESYASPRHNGTQPGRVWSFRDMTARMRAEEALRSLAKRVVEIQEEERQRVSRELHDDVSQRLTAIKLHLELFEDDLKDLSPENVSQIADIRRQVSEAVTSIRRISSNLRPAALDDFGLVIALQHLCADFEKLHDLTITFQSNTGPRNRFDIQTETAIYRIAQEALSNIVKHSGAQSVTLKLFNPGEDTIALDVHDAGKGFDVEEIQFPKNPRKGMGLISMKERTELLGGSFRIESKKKKGTTIHVEIPVNQ